MHGPYDFRKPALILLALFTASCDRATEPAPPAAARLGAATATTLTGTVRTEVVPAPTVRATDADGRAAPGLPVTFEVGKDGGEITTVAAITGADGLASVGRWTLGPIAKVQTVTARVSGLAEVAFNATAVAGPVARMQAVGGLNQVAWPGWPLSTALRVLVADSLGNPVVGAPVAFKVTAGGGNLASGSATTDSSGIAASGGWTLGPNPGTQQVLASTGSVSVSFYASAIQPYPELSGRLAFVSVVDGNSDIYAMKLDGGGVARLTTDPAAQLQPVWAPAGDQITYLAEREGTRRIFSMNADGSNVKGLTPEQSYGSDPSWSPDPDATTLAYTSLREETPGGGWSTDVVSLDTRTGANTILAADPGYDVQPAWSPDGRRLAFVSDREAYDIAFDIFSVNADGTGLVRLTQSFDVGSRGMQFYQHPAWSPDGTLIAFVWGGFVDLRKNTVRFHVAVMAPDGTGVRNLAWAGDMDWFYVLDPGSLAWSPDGRGIAFSFVDCATLTGAECERRSVKYVPLDGGEAITLVPNGHSPSWR
jgi:Tol biopolymer transport system component